ncbi:TetR/AcrR family transcriptional regulator [Nonomuraea aurantiaca]|uniref:TetR/AcrR family transcriptional regulator n=1 Tax=Nonomuraea aurantiaca TaxID=2878562 RepID=UPI001CD9246A|nr:TetR/AcrR family transcriptional regulator [Nonomuraea aurantiaca]MCA2224446.1 TetR/AcrR family transcriptional regulator [Nonomuraea aurantiaca]
MPAAGTSTKSDERRRAIVAAAMDCFAQKGFYGTTTHEIAERVGISQPYLYRLYPNKQALFAAVVDHVSVVMTETLVTHSRVSGGVGPVSEAASGGAGPTSEAVLDAARGAYAALIADRTILRFLMHANCAAGEPLVGEAVRRCYAKQVDVVRQLLGNDDAVRRWFGAGMLDNVVAVLGLADIDEPWARVLAAR